MTVGVLLIEADKMGTGHIIRIDGKVAGAIAAITDSNLLRVEGDALVRDKGVQVHFRPVADGYDLVARRKGDPIPQGGILKIIAASDVVLPQDISKIIVGISAQRRGAAHTPDGPRQ